MRAFHLNPALVIFRPRIQLYSLYINCIQLYKHIHVFMAMVMCRHITRTLVIASIILVGHYQPPMTARCSLSQRLSLSPRMVLFYSEQIKLKFVIKIQTNILICITKHISNLCFTNNWDLREV